MKKYILLVEDDPWQADAIEETLRERAKTAGIDLDVTIADSESDAQAKLVHRGGEMRQFAGYVIDLMLPWSQSEHPPEPDDAAVLGPGGMEAGLRLVDRIKLGRGTRGGRRNAVAPVFLYTIIENPKAKDIEDKQRGIFYLAKQENDAVLASRMIAMLKED